MQLARFSVLALAIAAASHAAPFLAIGDGAELFVTGAVGIRADDNIFLAKDAQSDVIFDINPGLELVFGRNAHLSGSLKLADNFANYADNSGLNSQLFTGDFSTKFDDGKMKLGFVTKYHELNQNQFDVRSTVVGGGRSFVRRDAFSAVGTAEVEISQLTSVGAGVSFDQDRYKRAGFSNLESLTVPVDFFYRWSPKLDLSIGYRYRDSRVDIGQDSTDHFFNVGARGELSPKLTGRFAVGVTTRNQQRGGEDTLLGLESSFLYLLSPKTDVEFGVSNDFGTSPRGQQEKNLTISAMLTSRIAEDWSVNGGLKWRSINYGGRTDDYLEGQLGTSYIVNANVRLLGFYTHRNYSSDLKLFEFQNNIFSIAANFRY